MSNGKDDLPPPVDEDTGGTSTTLSQLVGGIFYEPRYGVSGRLQVQTVGGTRQYRLITADGRKLVIAGGRQLIDPVTRQTYSIGNIFGNKAARDFNVIGQTKLTEADLNRLAGVPGTAGTGLGGGGVSARDFTAEAAQQHAYDLELERLKQEHQKQLEAEAHARSLELERIRQENQMRRDKLAEVGSLIRTAAEVKQRARDTIAALTGVDDFRAAVAAQGGVQRGVTPAQSFMGELRTFADAPLPALDENAPIPELQETIGALQGQQQLPVAPSLGFKQGGGIIRRARRMFPDTGGPRFPPLGLPRPRGRGQLPAPPQPLPPEVTDPRPPRFDPTFAFGRAMFSPMLDPRVKQGLLGLLRRMTGSSGFDEGGTMDMQQGADGTFRFAPQFGTTKTAVLVGEEGSQIAPGTEVMISDNQTGETEVIPLSMGSGMGMQEGGSFSPTAIRQSLAPVYGALGFTGSGPGVNIAPEGYSLQSVYGSGDIARRLGYQPRLIRAHDTGVTYFRDPSGNLRAVSPEVFQQSEFQQPNVFNVSSGELGGFGTIGSPLTAPPPLIEGGPQPFAQRPNVLFTPPETGSVPLPDPRLLAGLWRFLDPATRNVLISAYGVAGFGRPEQAEQTLLSTVRAFTPGGTGSRAGARLG